jgi:hypothetical protein
VDGSLKEVPLRTGGKLNPAVQETKFVNESAADLAAELQGPLSRHVGEHSIATLPEDVAERAFKGHLEAPNWVEGTVPGDPREFAGVTRRTDVEQPLPTGGVGSQVDPRSGLIDRYVVDSPVYGKLEGFVYRSVDGQTTYVVLRDGQGRVFVPSVQKSASELTPFGTRQQAYKTDLTKTPVTHGGDGYVPVDPSAWQNGLNRAAAQVLPPPGTAGKVGVPPGPPAPKVLGPGALAGLGGPSGRATATSSGAPSALQLTVTSLGLASGAAYTVQVVNRGPAPVRIPRQVVVMEPTRKVMPPTISTTSAGASSARGVVTADGYCVELRRPVPAPGQLYRVAPPEVQAKAAPLAKMLDAAEGLRDSGRLNPDSDPAGYFHSIRQWSIWVAMERLDERGFTEAFVERTRKNVQDLKRPWTKEMERAVRGAAPNRWRDIVQVLEGASR